MMAIITQILPTLLLLFKAYVLKQEDKNKALEQWHELTRGFFKGNQAAEDRETEQRLQDQLDEKLNKEKPPK